MFLGLPPAQMDQDLHHQDPHSGDLLGHSAPLPLPSLFLFNSPSLTSHLLLNISFIAQSFIAKS